MTSFLFPTNKKGIHSKKERILLPLGANSILLEWTPFQKGHITILPELYPLKWKIHSPIVHIPNNSWSVFTLHRSHSSGVWHSRQSPLAHLPIVQNSFNLHIKVYAVHYSTRLEKGQILWTVQLL